MQTTGSKSTPPRPAVNTQIPSRTLTRAEAKARLKELGWTYRTAAPVLGVTFNSLWKIFNGQYQNRRVLREIGKMGPSGRARYSRQEKGGER